MSDDFLWDLLSADPNTPVAGVHVPASPPLPQPRLIRWRLPHVICALIFGVCFDAATRADHLGIGTSLGITIAAVGLVAGAERRTRGQMALAASAIALGWCLFLRASTWLSLPTFIAAGFVLCLLGTPSATQRTGRVRDVLARVCRVLRGPIDFLGDMARRFRQRVERLRGRGRLPWAGIRGVALAAPVVAVLGSLLASGDAVFANSLSLKVPSFGPGLGHILMFGFGAVLVAMLFAASFIEPDVRAVKADRAVLGAVEAVVILGSVALLYLVFGGVQLFAALAGSSHVLETTGLTYAEYARSGFFQLLAVSVLTLFVLGLTRFAVGTEIRSRRVLAAISEALVVLTVGIVAVAFRRMSLYEHAYGLTMRRLLPHIVIVTLGVVFVLLGVSYAMDLRNCSGVHAVHRWLLPAIGTVCVGSLLATNVVNLEASVARSQLRRAERNTAISWGTVDVGEISGLGTDAIPSVVAWLKRGPAVSPLRASEMTSWVCSERPHGNWAGLTLSHMDAEEAQIWCLSSDSQAAE